MGAGSLDLGELYAKLAIDYSDLHKAELSARQFASNTNKELAKINKVADNLKSVGKNMSTYVTAPIVGAGAASLKFATDFDKAVREVNSLLDPKDQNFEGLKNQIRGVSLAIGTDLVESAKAAYSALGAGVPKDNLIEFLTVSSKAAIGGVTSVETAVDGFTSVMNAWGKSAGNVTEVSDVMFQAVKYGKVTFDQFASSISLVSGMAAEFGISFKEVAAYSALATAQGEKQTVAMTQMRQAIAELVKPNKELSKVIQDAGIKSIKTTLAQKGLAGTWDLLRKSADKNGTSLEKSIGSIEALQYVLRNTGKNAESAAGFLDLMSKSSGSADAAFKELDKARGFDKLVNSLKALATVIGDQLLPIVIPVVEVFTKWIVEASKLDPGLTRIAIALAAVTAAVGPVLLAAGSLLGFLAPLITGAGGLSAVIASITAVAGPVGLAFVAIAGAGYVLYKNWNEIKTFVIGFVDSVIAYFKKWQSENSELISSISSNWNAFVSSASALWETVSTMLVSFATSCIASLDSMLAPIGGLQGAWELFKVGVGIALTAIGQFLSDFLSTATNTFNAINNWLKTGGTSWEEFKDLCLVALKALSGGLTELFLDLGDFVIKIKDGLKDVPQAFKIIFEEVLTYIKSIDWLKLGTDMMTGLRNGIVVGAVQVIGAVKSGMDAVTESAREAIDSHSPSKVFMSIGKDIMTGLGLGITNNTSSAVSAMLAAGDTLNAVAKEKLTQQQFGTFEADLMLNTSMGTNGTNYDLELQKEQAYYEQSKQMLEQAQALKLASITSYAAIREQIESKHTNALIDIQRSALQSTVRSLDSTLTSLEQFGQKQSGIYKAIFAVSKAFAIADAMLAMQQNIANASEAGFPYNIPLIAGAIAQGASIVANVQSVSGAFNNGGRIASGQIGMVGEKGPEFVSGPANVFSTQNTKEALKGRGSNTNVKVNVMNYGNSKVEVTESGSNNEKTIQIIIDRTKQSIAADAIRGDGMVDRAFATVFKLPRTG